MTFWDFLAKIIEKDSFYVFLIIIAIVIIVCVGIVSICGAIAAFGERKK